MEYCCVLALVNAVLSSRLNGGVLNCSLHNRTNSSDSCSTPFSVASIKTFSALNPVLRSFRILNTCKFPLSNNGFTRTSHAEGETLDHHGYESFPGHDLADIDEIQLGQTNLVDTRHVPLGR